MRLSRYDAVAFVSVALGLFSVWAMYQSTSLKSVAVFALFVAMTVASFGAAVAFATMVRNAEVSAVAYKVFYGGLWAFILILFAGLIIPCYF